MVCRMKTIDYLGAQRRVVQDGILALRSSLFDPEGLEPVNLSIVESREGWFIVLAVSHDGRTVRQVGGEQPSLDAARAITTPSATIG